ncbi:MAG TPA: alpha/beta hydrolase [Myxococcota bacterium]
MKSKLVQNLERLAARGLFALPPRAQVLISGGKPVVVDGQTLHPEIQILVHVRNMLGAKGITDGTHAEARRRFTLEASQYPGPPVDIRGVTDLYVDGAEGKLAARHYAPRAHEPRPLLVFFHGGGFVVGDIESHDVVCRLLCHHANIHVLSVAYRLAPEQPFPAAVDDALAAYRWAVQHAAKTLGTSDVIGVGGDSAGGHIVAVLAQDLARAGAAQPAANLLLYPAVCRRKARPSLAHFASGFMLTKVDIDTFQRLYTGHLANDDDIRQRPLDGLAEMKGPLGPSIVVTAAFDPLRDEGDEYAEALAKLGGVVVHRRIAGFPHGFANLAGASPKSRAVVVDLAHDLQRLFAQAPRGSSS